ncbi:hypothetical protein FRB96_001584 [Tulasnella sp. 330]|nr:hypothetical protein FRB96_001584 [Tulasnella sp. 330]
MQVVLAGARIDIGSILLSNILVHRNLVGAALQETVHDPVTGGATGIWSQLIDPNPVTVNGINPTNECIDHDPELKLKYRDLERRQSSSHYSVFLQDVYK